MDGPAGERLARVIAAIDAVNADDPHRLVVRGVERPKEQAHAELATEWIERLRPDASDALRIAARAHHVKRWAIPRADYPAGKKGYLTWRKALQKIHAETAGELMIEAGYDPRAVARVQDIVRKRGLGRDPEVQAFEDALCLVFLETQLDAVDEALDEDHLVDVLRKTLRKMSAEGIAAARDLPLGDRGHALLARAAEEETDGRS